MATYLSSEMFLCLLLELVVQKHTSLFKCDLSSLTEVRQNDPLATFEMTDLNCQPSYDQILTTLQ